MPLDRPNVFTIAPGLPFLRTLVATLVSGRLIDGWQFDPDDPLSFADVTLLVPTRRAARALRDEILAELGGRAAILPRIQPIGDVDEDELAVGDMVAGLAASDIDVPPAIAGMERQLILTQLVAGWRKLLIEAVVHPASGEPIAVPASPADAVHLAAELIGLMDQAATEEIDWSRLAGLVADQFAGYWQLTLKFLSIVTEIWPAMLAERGAVDPTHRRRLLIDREVERLRRTPPRGPIIAAGSTGSIPATARLLSAIARLPQGAIVLPGLDQISDDAVWTAIGGGGAPLAAGEMRFSADQAGVPGHPQFGLANLLRVIGVDRRDVVALGAPTPALAKREAIVHAALRPSDTTDAWRDFHDREIAGDRDAVAAAFAGMGLITARTDQEEGLAIALALREAIETPGRTAALVTPDRTLARRVAAELTRWGLAVDDSAGVPLGSTPAGSLARLVADVALAGADPVAVLALIKHPLTTLGKSRAATLRAAQTLEIAALRGPRPRPGLAGIGAALAARKAELATPNARPPLARARISPWAWTDAEDLAARLTRAIGGLEAYADAEAVPVKDLIGAHVAAIRAMATDTAGRDDALYAGETGEALATFLADLIEAVKREAGDYAIAGRDYPGFLAAFMSGRAVRRRQGQDPRIAIWGPLEARLQRVGRLVLGGLNEGTWPMTTRSDPWLSRPMRAGLALEPPERRIGLAAHDFAQGLGAEEVILSRAERSGGTPTVASRWLQRLGAVLGPDEMKVIAGRGARFARLARRVDRRVDAAARPVDRPAPCPAVETRPVKLSVTEIETLIRDPYAIHARHILRLEPIEPVASPPGHADRGSLIHDILAEFVAGWNGPWDLRALPALEAIGQAHFARLADFPEVAALWWPRFGRIARFFLATEASRDDILTRRVEIGGRFDLPGVARPFRLTGRADRIDIRAGGMIDIIDYKTGSPPSAAQVYVGLSPQLALEAVMARHGAFDGIDATAPLGRLEYWHLSGSTEGGRIEARAPLKPPRGGQGEEKSADDLAGEAEAKLAELVNAYADPATRYPSRPRIQFARDRDGPYDHLARVAEWAGAPDDGKDPGEAE